MVGSKKIKVYAKFKFIRANKKNETITTNHYIKHKPVGVKILCFKPSG